MQLNKSHLIYLTRETIENQTQKHKQDEFKKLEPQGALIAHLSRKSTSVIS